MALIKYVEFDGTVREVEVKNGSSVMQGAVDHMVEGIVGECGGCCSCSTCHCMIDEAWAEQVGPPNEDESELLEFAGKSQPNSRLSCQIEVTDALDGLVVHLPESQYE